MLESLIFQLQYSIPDTLCDDIIIMYELENSKYPGVTLGGVNKDIKDTTDFIIPKNDNKWKRIEKFLYEELSNGLKKYLIYLNENIFSNTTIKYDFFDKQDLQVETFMIQKYDMKKGKYLYHHDFSSDNNSTRHRVITYIWYLNDIFEGGETEFWGGTYNVRPETGKLLLFPAQWSFPHRGKTPQSDNKYIITGWFYANY
jgi:hypothetical protein